MLFDVLEANVDDGSKQSDRGPIQGASARTTQLTYLLRISGRVMKRVRKVFLSITVFRNGMSSNVGMLYFFFSPEVGTHKHKVVPAFSEQDQQSIYTSVKARVFNHFTRTSDAHTHGCAHVWTPATRPHLLAHSPVGSKALIDRPLPE